MDRTILDTVRSCEYSKGLPIDEFTKISKDGFTKGVRAAVSPSCNRDGSKLEQIL